MNPAAAFAAGYLCCLFTFVPLGLFAYLFRPWLRAFLSGSRASAPELLGARLRGSPVHWILDAQLAMIQRGTPIGFKDVERVYIVQRHRVTGPGDLIGFVEQQLAEKDKA